MENLQEVLKHFGIQDIRDWGVRKAFVVNTNYPSAYTADKGVDFVLMLRMCWLGMVGMSLKGLRKHFRERSGICIFLGLSMERRERKGICLLRLRSGRAFWVG